MYCWYVGCTLLDVFKIMSLLFGLVFLFHFETKAALFCRDHFESNLDRSGVIVVNHQTLRYVSAGDPMNPPLLMIHGAPGRAENWNYFLNHPELKSRFHLIAVDRLGYGGSERGESETSLKKQAAMIVEVLSLNQSSKPAIVIGYSFGGPVAARVAIEYPEKVSGLILVSSLASPDYIRTKWYFQFVKYIVNQVETRAALKVFFDEIAPLRNELEEMKPLWSQIKSKMIVIHGDEDTSVPIDNADFISDELSGNRGFKKQILHKTGHQILKKQPVEILKAIQLLIQN